MPDAISLLRESCESLLAQLVQFPVLTATRNTHELAEEVASQVASQIDNHSYEVEWLLDLIRRSVAEPFAGQRLQHEVLKAARQLGECYAKTGLEVRPLIGQLLQTGGAPDSASQPRQLRQTEILACAVEAYLAERTRQLTEQAQLDALTQLFNRAVFDQRLRDELARARRYERALLLVLFDLDQFKLVNDRLGHPAGDAVLQQFANLLQASLRQSDLAFRYGGDEFAALLPETSHEAANHILQRLQERLRYATQTAGWREPVGISFGLASFPADADSALALLKVADARLYECKRANQLRVKQH